VAQIHVAGHTKFEKYILDTHDHPVLDPVWKLYAHAIRGAGVTATLLEWDDKIPSFDEVHAEALKANEFIAGARAAKAVMGGGSREAFVGAKRSRVPLRNRRRRDDLRRTRICGRCSA
jgi:uncharacterized protein (UPF0276 family)